MKMLGMMGCTFDLSTPGRGRQSSLNLNQAWSAQGVPSQSVQHSETASKDKEERKEGREGRRTTDSRSNTYLPCFNNRPFQQQQQKSTKNLFFKKF